MKKDVVFETPWFEIQARKSVTGSDPHYVVVPPDYVTIVALTENDQLVLVEQYRPAVQKTTLEFPSGLVDPGENPHDTAVRELLEETGFIAHDVQFLGTLLPDTGRLGNKLWCFFTRVDDNPLNNAIEEGIRVVRLSLPDLAAKVTSGEFDHAIHCGVLALAHIKGFITFTA